MAQVKFEIVVDIKGTYGDDTVLDRPMPVEGDANRTLKGLFKEELENRFKEQAKVIRGDIQSKLVSSTVTDL